MKDQPKDKCAHPSCLCRARSDSKYCSTYCEGEAETADIECSCGHPACTKG
jgi:hypothetical protein